MESHRIARKAAIAFALGVLSVAAGGAALDSHGVVAPFPSVKLADDGDVKCLKGAVETGDPDKGPSTLILTASPGCVVAPHFHTAGEQLLVARGEVMTGMDGMKPAVLGAGGFAAMPGRVVHWFTCRSKTPCTMFVIFDAKYDIVWVKRP